MWGVMVGRSAGGRSDSARSVAAASVAVMAWGAAVGRASTVVTPPPGVVSGRSVPPIASARPRPPEPIPAAVQRAVVRIAQESLTNASRHASPRKITLTVSHEPQAIVLDVANDGVHGSGDGPGSGMLGMRERVEALGGQLSAGPTGDGRFQVHARLPWQTAP